MCNTADVERRNLNLSQDELAHVLAGILNLASDYANHVIEDSKTFNGHAVDEHQLWAALQETRGLIPRIWALMTPTSRAWFAPNVHELAEDLTSSFA